MIFQQFSHPSDATAPIGLLDVLGPGQGMVFPTHDLEYMYVVETCRIQE